MIQYDHLAQDFEDTRGKDVPLKLIKTILARQNIDCSSKILDLGCGTGRISIAMQMMTGAQVTGIDNSSKMLDIAAKKYDKIKWIKDDLDNLKFQGSNFDLILLVFVIHHLNNLDNLLENIKTMLSPQGSLIIVTVSREHIMNWPKTLCLDIFPRFIEIDLARFQDVDVLKQKIEKIGFKVCIDGFNDETVYKKEEYIARVKKKYLSTLAVLSDDEFELGFRRFLHCLDSKFGDTVVSKSDFVIIQARNSQHINTE